MALEKVLISILVVFFCITIGNAVVTKEQMDQAAGLIRQSCMGKNKITEEQADLIKKGQLPTYKEGKCYLHCIFEMGQAMKKSKMTLDNFFKQVDLLIPEDMRADIKDSFTQCKDAPQGVKDPCEAGLLLFKCLVEVTNGEKEFI